MRRNIIEAELTDEEYKRITEEADSITDEEFQAYAERVVKMETALSSIRYHRDHAKTEAIVAKYEDKVKPIEITIPVTIKISLGNSRERARVELSSNQQVHDEALKNPDVIQWLKDVKEVYASLSESDRSALEIYNWDKHRNWHSSSDGLEEHYIPPMYFKYGF